MREKRRKKRDAAALVALLATLFFESVFCTHLHAFEHAEAGFGCPEVHDHGIFCDTHGTTSCPEDCRFDDHQHEDFLEASSKGPWGERVLSATSEDAPPTALSKSERPARKLPTAPALPTSPQRTVVLLI